MSICDVALRVCCRSLHQHPLASTSAASSTCRLATFANAASITSEHTAPRRGTCVCTCVPHHPPVPSFQSCWRRRLPVPLAPIHAQSSLVSIPSTYILTKARGKTSPSNCLQHVHKCTRTSSTGGYCHNTPPLQELWPVDVCIVCTYTSSRRCRLSLSGYVVHLHRCNLMSATGRVYISYYYYILYIYCIRIATQPACFPTSNHPPLPPWCPYTSYIYNLCGASCLVASTDVATLSGFCAVNRRQLF